MRPAVIKLPGFFAKKKLHRISGGRALCVSSWNPGYNAWAKLAEAQGADINNPDLRYPNVSATVDVINTRAAGNRLFCRLYFSAGHHGSDLIGPNDFVRSQARQLALNAMASKTQGPPTPLHQVGQLVMVPNHRVPHRR